MPRAAIREGFQVDDLDWDDRGRLVGAVDKHSLLSQTYRSGAVPREAEILINRRYHPVPLHSTARCRPGGRAC